MLFLGNYGIIIPIGPPAPLFDVSHGGTFFMPDPIKNPTTYEQQLAKLKSRGCMTKDDAFCIAVLKTVNYYRLSAYFLPFKKNDDTYVGGTSFEQVFNIYEFDRKLRRIIFSAIEEIEVFTRAAFAYFHAHKYGDVGYFNEKNYSAKHQHEKFKKLIEQEIHSNRNVPFVRHHTQKYNGMFPIWVIVELFTFGMLSFFFADLNTQDQKDLARAVFHSTANNIKSWLRCCTDLRNICAHYGRLYYRNFPSVPAGFKTEGKDRYRLWTIMQSVKGLYYDAGKWNTSILKPMVNLFKEYKDDINLAHIAFPLNWVDLLTKK